MISSASPFSQVVLAKERSGYLVLPSLIPFCSVNAFIGATYQDNVVWLTTAEVVLLAIVLLAVVVTT